MKKTYLLIIILGFGLFCVYESQCSRMKILTEQDETMLKQYQDSRLTKNLDELPIVDYILEKVKPSSSHDVMIRGMKLITLLSNEHKKYFEKSIMTYLKTKFIEKTFSKKYNPSKAIYTLGHMRTKSSIDFLLNLILPAEKWPEEIQKPFFELKVKNKKDFVYLYSDIRYDALGSLLSVDDDLTKNLLIQIEEIVNKLDEDDFQKKYLLERIEAWKVIYSEGFVKTWMH
jgi:hypothetical protein